MGCFYYMPYFLTAVKGQSATQAGTSLLAVAACLIPGAIVAGIIMSWIGKYRWAIWLGWILSTVGMGLAALWDKGTGTVQWAATMVVFGVGQGMALNSQNTAAQSQCVRGDEGAATAMFAFVRQLGSALGVGIGSSIFQNAMANKLEWMGLDKGIAHDSEAFVAVLAKLPDTDPFKWAVIDAYVAGFRAIFWTYFGLAALSLLMSLLIRHSEMHNDVVTDHTLQEVKLWTDVRHQERARQALD
jgi:MFS family permease